LRDRLLGELSAITDGDEATVWAHRSLAAKNSLTTSDAARVEAEFTSRMAALTTTNPADASLPSPQAASKRATAPGEPSESPARAALMAALRASVELGTAKGPGRPVASDGERLGERVNNAVSWHIDKTVLTP
jgi:hypothetical protein